MKTEKQIDQEVAGINQAIKDIEAAIETLHQVIIDLEVKKINLLQELKTV